MFASSLVAIGCGPGSATQESDLTEAHEHREVSYEKIFGPVVDRLAETSTFGAGMKVGYDAATDFARTDFAHSACLDSPDLWGLEMSVGGNLGVGYYQGVEFSFESGAINMNCLNQLELSPELEVGARVNLIRHFGECHAEGETLEETIFVELGTGVDTTLGLSLGVGVAYTAGLSKGLLNQTLPTFLSNTYDNWFTVVDDVVAGAPVFDPPADPAEHQALCNETSAVFNGKKGNVFKGGREVHAEKLNGFLRDYIEANTHCENVVAEVVEHDEHEEGDEHDDDLHSWTVCSDLTLKSAIGFARSRVAERRAAATGLPQKVLGQLEITVALLDDLFSGCDHIEFQFEAGVGASTPATATIGLESHNYYGTLSFDGTDEQLGAALESALGPTTFDDPTGGTGFTNWAIRKICGLVEDQPVYSAFSILPVDSMCKMIETARATLGFVETLRKDPRFHAEFATSLQLWGLSLPLPNNALANYAVTCSLGPMRNMLELLWY